MKLNYKILSIVLAVIIVLGVVVTYGLPRYRQKIADDVVFSVAMQQTTTGNIFYINNNTVQLISISNLCGGENNGRNTSYKKDFGKQ